MPPKKTTGPPPPATGYRPYNSVLLSIFALLSFAGLWFMRISSALNDAPTDFIDVVTAGTHTNGVAIKKDFTGIKFLDEGVSFLVSAFLPGTAGWNEVFYWQQFHFLFQITTLIAVCNVEACRERNQSSVLKYTALWALVYQNIGGAIIITIWTLLLHRISGPNSYFQAGRTVPVQYARLLLPSTILLYIVPTIAIFVPGLSITTLQTLVAFWQFTPIFVNIPLWLAAPSVPKGPATGAAKTADVNSLKYLYNTLLVYSIGIHGLTIFKIMSSTNPSVTLMSVFLPNFNTWKTDMASGLLWIFQWDWLIIALVQMIPAFIAIYDVQRLLPDLDDDKMSDKLINAAYVVVALTVLGGPGAATAAVWGWREDHLVIMEERVEAAKGKKGE